ncbi:hypothetical protein [Pontibacillus litoralis]|uniref:Flagellar hook-length control protein-like C-terminal domain-containing protein n=1 Tax=Pontibacillus litoralis JSM 072002 TaxID=1385512 RepID=A0A0A5G8U8_9BACI|nr:hypothetical protein [Pontibacillus litoralis]KGX88464.1 hypothetical protein N784_07295 [Pontibacillus litoralis JSM 072002]
MSSQLVSKVMETIKTSGKSNNDSRPLLKAGQMITGRVTKLYPNQRAQIQLGTQRLTAQLEAPLDLHERYLFRVKSTDSIIQLHVVDKLHGTRGEKDASTLLQHLGYAVSKERLSLLQQLMKHDIPFQQQELKQALHLLEQMASKQGREKVIVHMLSQGMPLSKTVFHALHTRIMEPLTLLSTLQAIQAELISSTSNRLQHQLLHPIQSLLHTSSQTVMQAMGETLQWELVNQQQDAFQLLKKIGIIDRNVSLSSFMKDVVTNRASAFSITEGTSLSSTLSMGMKSAVNVHTILHSTLSQQLPVHGSAKRQFQLWANTLSQYAQLIAESGDSTNELTKHASALKQHTQGLFTATNTPVLLATLKQTVDAYTYQMIEQLVRVKGEVLEIKQPSKQWVDFSLNMQKVASQQVTKADLNLITQWLSHGIEIDGSPSSLPLKDAFYVQLKSALYALGMDHEFTLKNQIDKGQGNLATIKAAIIQALQEPVPSVLSEKLQTALHHLNGMPLQMVENNQMLQMTLQLPGEWFGIAQDLLMNMEGKKSEENDEIDSDYCHILFYLQLNALKETVIDMRVQKRIVQVIIYTEKSDLSPYINSLKPTLAKGLEKVGYQLSSVQYKPIEEEVRPKRAPTLKQDKYQGGIDFKV